MKTTRNFNYTGRRNLPRTHASVELKTGQNSTPASFRAALNFENANLLPKAKVFVEAYYKTALMRFDYGTVAQVASQAERWHDLADLQSNIAFFRVKVVGTEGGTRGRILAAIDRIKPRIEDAFEAVPGSLLFVHFTPELGDRPWRVTLDSEHPMPVLEVSDAMGFSPDVVRHAPAFVGLVLPAVAEQVLTHILLGGDEQLSRLSDTGEDDWAYQWLRFASRLQQAKLDVAALQSLDPEQRRDWCDAAVQAFCTRHNLAELMRHVEWGRANT